MDRKQLAFAIKSQLDYLADIIKGDTYGSGLRDEAEQFDALSQIELMRAGVEKLAMPDETDKKRKGSK